MPKRKIHAEVRPIEKMWLSNRETKAYLDCADEYLKKLRDNALVTFARDGKMIWYLKSSIDEYLQKHAISAFA
ncbi:MAG: DNA-binding protein [Bacteroidaceae bacterium]|jgi:hypothetical protein|nr:DNA-binding protein [Bacteroidaceae bacterium]